MAMENAESLPFNRRSRIKKATSGILKVIKLPHFNRFPIQKIDQIKQIPTFLFRHKFIAGGAIFSVALIIFIAGAIYRGYFMISATTDRSNSSSGTKISKTNNSIASSAKPTLVSPSPSDNPSPSQSTVLGASDGSSSDTSDDTNSVPSVAVSPIPTDIPEPTATPASTSSSSGNSNCTTVAGVPNSWYSDFYPVSPISTSNGSVTLTVNIRDCNINNVSSSSILKISLSSGDPNTQINGQSLPVSITTQNGQASFTVSSQVNGTVGLTIQDTTDSFSVTDTNNSNPNINFNGSSETPTPTQSANPTPTQPVSPAPSVTQNPSPTQ